MKDEYKFNFFPAEEKFKDIILAWFSKDFIKEFYYGDGLQNTLNNLDLYMQGIKTNGSYYFDHWVAFINDEPLGFLMTSPITGPYDESDDYNKWYVEKAKSLTLDLLIGNEKYLGKGIAHKMIQRFITDKFSTVDYFLIDPSETNPKAIRVYEKAGFTKKEVFYPSYDPIPHLMMRLSVKKLMKSKKEIL